MSVIPQKAQSILVNAGALLSARIVGSGLGFVYWLVASKYFVPGVVGFASATISAMLLIATIGVAGFDILMVGEVPKQRGQPGILIASGMMTAGLIAGALGAIFAWATPNLSSDLADLAENTWAVLLFACGTALTAMALVFDQAMIGLLRSSLQLGRNLMFSLIKLLWLMSFALWFQNTHGLTILVSWAMGDLIALLFVCFYLLNRGINLFHLPDMILVRDLGGVTFKHYVLNLALQAPGFALPPLVTVVISVEATAYYYVAWMIAALVYMIPHALTMVLYAIGSRDCGTLEKYMRITLPLSLGAGMLIASVMFLGADVLLGFFGPMYTIEAGWALRVLCVGVLPLSIKFHYVTLRRAENRIGEAAGIMWMYMVFELAASVVGAYFGDLLGLSLGWVVVLTIEAILLTPTLIRAARKLPALAD